MQSTLRCSDDSDKKHCVCSLRQSFDAIPGVLLERIEGQLQTLKIRDFCYSFATTRSTPPLPQNLTAPPPTPLAPATRALELTPQRWPGGCRVCG
jgi:hypothetical protein